MGTVTSGNIVAGALESRAAPSSNTFVSHANSTVTIESSTEYAAGGQEIETYNLTTLNPAEAFVYEKRGVGKKQGYPGLCIVSDQKDGSQVFVDRGPSRHPITDYGHTHHDSGGSVTIHNSTSIFFDGTGDYLLVPTSDDFSFGTGPFTIELWAHHTSVSGEQFYFDAPAVTGKFTWQKGTDHKINFIMNSPNHTNTTLDSTYVMAVDTWVHVALVGDGNRNVRTFFNGVLTDTATFDYNFVHNGQLEIGREYSNQGYFTGYMDDIRIVKGHEIYKSNFIPPSRSPKGTEVAMDPAEYTKITMVGYREDSSSYFTAINYVAGNEIIARDYMGIPYGHLQAVAYIGGTQKIIIYNSSTDALSFTAYVESTT